MPIAPSGPSQLAPVVPEAPRVEDRLIGVDGTCTSMSSTDDRQMPGQAASHRSWQLPPSKLRSVLSVVRHSLGL